MSKSNNNGTNKTAPKSRKGPRPIMTVAMLREKMLKEMMVKEVRKIERKMSRLVKRERQLEDKLATTIAQIDNLKILHTEYAAEVAR